MMICLSDLSELMQKAIAEKMMFLISPPVDLSGVYSLRFAKNDKGILLHYRRYKNNGEIWQWPDGTHPLIAFDDIDDVLKYVRNELGDTK